MPDVIRPASEADVDQLMKLRLEAEAWLAEAGIDQWRNPDTRPRALEKWRADIRAGRTWMIETPHSSEALGTVTLAEPDPDFWRASDEPDSAVYVAKLITARSTKGQDLGGRILDWAGGVARAKGLPWLRLDCWRENRQLQRYYERRGFRHVRTEAPAHRLSGWMAQRPADLIFHPDDPLATRSNAAEQH